VKSLLESLVRQMQDGGILYTEALEAFKKAFVAAMLERHGGNQSRAARALGVHRNTVSRAMTAFNIAVKHPPRASAQGLNAQRRTA
jgi:two-component system nitrogen regulation response regulator GlnG